MPRARCLSAALLAGPVVLLGAAGAAAKGPEPYAWHLFEPSLAGDATIRAGVQTRVTIGFGRGREPAAGSWSRNPRGAGTGTAAPAL